MNKIFDETITWPGLHSTHDAICQVQIFEDRRNAADRKYIVIMTEPPDNPGTSVTNGVELIAARILADHNLPFFETAFIEHYPDRQIPNRPPSAIDAETFDAVIFELERGRPARPAWARVSWAKVAAAIGADGKQWSEI